MASTVILGSGIIGLSTAFYLAKHQPGSSIHLVDSSPRLFASASGYAGGFIAKDWFHPDVASLGELSFYEHKKLAEKEGGYDKWGYTRTISVNYEPKSGRWGGREQGRQGVANRADVVQGKRRELEEREEIPPWLNWEAGETVSLIDDGEGAAIIDPLKLCEFLLERCVNAGVQIHHPATALDVSTDVRGELSAVRIGYSESSTETEIPATRLVIMAGAWTPKVFRFLFRSSTVHIPVESLGGHSLVVRSPKLQAGQASHSVYCRLDTLSPELYARPTGVIYLAGVNSSSLPLPDVATGAEPLDGPIEELKALARSFIAGPVDQNKDKKKDKNKDQDIEVVRTGLCFRPITARGTPILARVDDAQLGDAISTRPGPEGGVFVATGHAFWGISLSLGTGKVMAQMIQGRKLSADIGRLGL